MNLSRGICALQKDLCQLAQSYNAWRSRYLADLSMVFYQPRYHIDEREGLWRPSILSFCFADEETGTLRVKALTLDYSFAQTIKNSGILTPDYFFLHNILQMSKCLFKPFNCAMLSYTSCNGVRFQKKILCIAYEYWNVNSSHKFKNHHMLKRYFQGVML